MERLHLTTAPAPPAPPTTQRTRVAASALALGLATIALAASGLGADAARGPAASTARAAAIVDAALGSDTGDPGSLPPLREIRADLGRRPLDARTRVLYAGLLLDFARDAGERSIAIFHARRAIALAPVTVPVVRAAAVVLARAGAGEDAIDRARAMFFYDANEAAQLFAAIEAFLPEGSIDRALPDLPAAWLAWARRLARTGRAAESTDRLERGCARWPGDNALLEEAAGRAAGRHDWTRLDALFAAAGPAQSLRSPQLLALRARGRAERGDREGARSDVAAALQRGAHDSNLLSAVGDALASAGDLDDAAARWREALYRLPRTPGAHGMRISLLTRLARLGERRNHTGDALRSWRAVLAADPAHEEARRRILALTGAAP